MVVRYSKRNALRGMIVLLRAPGAFKILPDHIFHENGRFYLVGMWRDGILDTTKCYVYSIPITFRYTIKNLTKYSLCVCIVIRKIILQKYIASYPIFFFFRCFLEIHHTPVPS